MLDKNGSEAPADWELGRINDKNHLEMAFFYQNLETGPRRRKPSKHWNKDKLIVKSLFWKFIGNIFVVSKSRKNAIKMHS